MPSQHIVVKGKCRGRWELAKFPFTHDEQNFFWEMIASVYQDRLSLLGLQRLKLALF